MEAIVFLGAPGAGKGTLAGVICGQTGFVHVSTGDILRTAIQEETAVGLEAKSFMDSGQLVPDPVILKLIEERIESDGKESRYLFDGFPRTIEQAEGLDRIFSARNGVVSHVFRLDAERSVLIQRLSGRRICRVCGAVYHVTNHPPEKEGVCDLDGGELIQRSDDREDAIQNRLDVYQKQTAPLISFYQSRNLLRGIDAGDPVDRIASRILNVLNA